MNQYVRWAAAIEKMSGFRDFISRLHSDALVHRKFWRLELKKMVFRKKNKILVSATVLQSLQKKLWGIAVQETGGFSDRRPRAHIREQRTQGGSEGEGREGREGRKDALSHSVIHAARHSTAQHSTAGCSRETAHSTAQKGRAQQSTQHSREHTAEGSSAYCPVFLPSFLSPATELSDLHQLKASTRHCCHDRNSLLICYEAVSESITETCIGEDR